MNYRDLATATLLKYPNLDPKRVERALVIVENKTIKLSRYDEDGAEIIPTKAAYCVKSPKTAGREEVWYIVRPEKKSCQCYDSAAGNICKHRIAVYLYQELPLRQFAELTQKIPASVV